MAILFAIGFPRATTTLITAILGALGLMAGVYCLVHIYKPQLSDYLPSGTFQSYAIMVVLIAVGLAIQYRFFWRLPDKSPELRQTECLRISLRSCFPNGVGPAGLS